MEKFQVDPNNDITKEPYQGASKVIEAAGRGTVEHLLYAFSGMIGVGALAYAAHGNAAKIIDAARNTAKNLKSTAVGDGFAATTKRGLGSFMSGVFGNPEAAAAIRANSTAMGEQNKELIESLAMNRAQGFGNALLSHTIGLIPTVRKGMVHADSRLANAITLGGAAGAGGYAFGWSKAVVLGAATGGKGKRQFERAKAEVNDLRERNDDLEKINDKLHADYRAAATRLQQIRAEEEKLTPPKFGPSDSPIGMDASPASAVQLANSEHQGKLQAAPAVEAAIS
jgi:hypothetical protein